MTGQVFSIFDQKACAFGLPWFSPGRGTAFRSFESLVNDGQSTCSKYPADFVLYHLGEFEDTTAKFTLLDTPVPVVSANELVHRAGPQPA